MTSLKLLGTIWIAVTRWKLGFFTLGGIYSLPMNRTSPTVQNTMDSVSSWLVVGEVNILTLCQGLCKIRDLKLILSQGEK
jgi:hypothetical protein